LGRPDPVRPTIHDYEGLVLRGRRDGAVLQRKVFWASTFDAGLPVDSGPFGTTTGGAARGGDFPWPLFVDEQPEP
jgi:hypothetical protein